MWSAEHRVKRVSVVLACAMLAGACQVRPLYGPTPSGMTTGAELAAIDVRPATGGRIGQMVHNELALLLSRGGAEGSTYQLNISAASSRGDLTVRLVGGEPQGSFVHVSTSYTLTRRGDPTPILTGSVLRQVTFETTTSQKFADDRAEIDAQKRAAREIAEEIRLRLAAFFMNGQVGPDQTAPAAPNLGQTQADRLQSLGGTDGGL